MPVGCSSSSQSLNQIGHFYPSFCTILISMWYFLFITGTTENSDLQRYDFFFEEMWLSNVKPSNSVHLVLCTVSDRCCYASIDNWKYLMALCEFAKAFWGNLAHRLATTDLGL